MFLGGVLKELGHPGPSSVPSAQPLPDVRGFLLLDKEHLRGALLHLLHPVAQLRELIHSDRSVDSHEEDQDNRFLTSGLTEMPRPARGIRQREIGSRLTQLGAVHTRQIVLPQGFADRLRIRLIIPRHDK